MATMKALHLTKTPDSSPAMAILTLPKPKYQPGHLLIRIAASAIHPSDLVNAKGLFPATTFPRIPGRDFSGTIVEGPADRIGEEVYGTSGNTQAFTVDGAQAEYILVREDAVARKPKNLSWVQAATVGVPFTTAAAALNKASVGKDDVVLVLGANGAVGSAVVQLARARGAKVLQGTRNDSGDVNTAADPDLAAVDKLTSGKGVNIVIDTVGQPALTRASVLKLSVGGKLVFIAAPRAGSTELGIEMLDFYRKMKTLIGINTLLFKVEEFAAVLNDMRAFFEDGVLTAAKEGDWNEVPLQDAVETYRKAGERGAGKFVIVMQ